MSIVVAVAAITFPLKADGRKQNGQITIYNTTAAIIVYTGYL